MVLSAAQVKEAIDACDLTADERAEVEGNPVLYEQPTETVNMSIDDVVVKKQKLHRTGLDEENEMSKDDEKTGRQFVHNTVAHLQHQEQSSCITGQGVPSVLRILLGYLLTNALLGCRLQFSTNVARGDSPSLCLVQQHREAPGLVSSTGQMRTTTQLGDERGHVAK